MLESDKATIKHILKMFNFGRDVDITDLNALHKLEEMIVGSYRWNKYVENLCIICKAPQECYGHAIVSADAERRAEAIAKTVW